MFQSRKGGILHTRAEGFLSFGDESSRLTTEGAARDKTPCQTGLQALISRKTAMLKSMRDLKHTLIYLSICLLFLRDKREPSPTSLLAWAKAGGWNSIQASPMGGRNLITGTITAASEGLQWQDTKVWNQSCYQTQVLQCWTWLTFPGFLSVSMS